MYARDTFQAEYLGTTPWLKCLPWRAARWRVIRSIIATAVWCSCRRCCEYMFQVTWLIGLPVSCNVYLCFKFVFLLGLTSSSRLSSRTGNQLPYTRFVIGLCYLCLPVFTFTFHDTIPIIKVHSMSHTSIQGLLKSIDLSCIWEDRAASEVYSVAFSQTLL